MENSVKSNARSGANILKFIVLNLIGIFMFFVTVKIGETSSIPVDHVVTAIRKIPYFDLVYGAVIVVVARCCLLSARPGTKTRSPWSFPS